MTLLPQLGFFELMMLAALALVVVGPKDLPRLMYGLGKVIAQIKGMAAEFRSGFDQIEEMRKEIAALKKMNPLDEVRAAAEDAVSPLTREKTSARPRPDLQDDPFFPPDPPADAASREVQMDAPAPEGDKS